jgi:hypothetical protein
MYYTGEVQMTEDYIPPRNRFAGIGRIRLFTEGTTIKAVAVEALYDPRGSRREIRSDEYPFKIIQKKRPLARRWRLVEFEIIPEE